MYITHIVLILIHIFTLHTSFNSHSNMYIRHAVWFSYTYMCGTHHLILILIHTLDTSFDSHTYIYTLHTPFDSHTYTYIRHIIWFPLKYLQYTHCLILIHIHTSDTSFDAQTDIYIRQITWYSYISAQEASWKRGFDPIYPLSVEVYH